MGGWLALLLAAAVTQSPTQDEVKVEATLSASSVVTGATVVLEVRVETPGVRAVRVNLPPLPPTLSVVGTQDFTHDQMRIPGGRTRIVQRNVILLPERPGTFLIPTIPVDVEGTTYRTAPLQLEVLPSGTPPPSSLPDVQVEDIRLTARLDRSTVYVGEQVVLEVEALFPREMRQRQTRPATFETPNPPGFWVAELPGGLTGGVRLFRGDYYETQRYRRVYVPLEPGTFTLDPVRLQYEIRRGHLYGAEQREQVSDSLRLRVLPLPAAGRPESFTGAVGHYRATAQLQPQRVAAGDAVTLSFEVTGTGNVKTLPPPRLPQMDGVEIFPPSEDAEVSVRGDRLGGTKRFTWVLVPEQDGTVDIGTIEYAFFDPETGGYGVSRADPLSLDVSAARMAGSDVADTALARIRPIPRRPRLGFVRSPLYLAAQVVPIFALLGVLLMRRRRDAPEAIRREQRARWEAALDGVAMETGDGRAFLGRLASVVRAALAERTGRTGLRAAPGDAVRVELEAAGVSTYAATAAAALLRRLDHARFGGAAEGLPAPDALVGEARSVLERVERELGPRPSAPGNGVPLALVLLLVLPAAVRAQDANAAFRGGVTAYLRGDYPAAIAAFETYIAEHPNDASAWYNLGNAYRGAADDGRAVWAWRRALDLEPRSGATRRNLRLTTRAALDGAPAPFALTAAEAGLVLGVCWWLACGAFAWATLRGGRAPRVVALGAAIVGLGAAAAGAPTLLLDRHSAVALDGRTPLLAGPAMRSDTVAVVPAGTPVRIVGRAGPWLRVRTSDRAEGWGTPDRFAEVPPSD